MSESTETKKAPKKGAKAVTESVFDTFPYEMLEAKSNYANVDPNSLLFPKFDSRADSDSLKLDPSFAEEIKNTGVLQPPLVTPVRHKDTGVEGLLIVAGRQRVRAAIAAANAKNKTVPVHVKTMTLKEAVVACGVENIKRRALSFWDEASYMLMLRDEYGMKQTEIKDKLGVSDAKVSQALAVFDLDERVQKLVRKGQMEPGTNTKVRALKAVKDADQQYGIAVKAIESGWTADDIDEAVARLAAKQAAAEKAAQERAEAKRAAAAAAEAGAVPPKKVVETSGHAFDIAKIVPITKAEFHALLESVGAKIEKLRSKDTVDEVKLAYERGKLDGIKLTANLKALPKSLVADDEE